MEEGTAGNTANIPETIVIIDDEEVNRVILREIFKRNYKILEAHNGNEGLELILAHKEKICAILLDVMMPEMDGMEVLRRLNRLGLQNRIPVFLITAERSDRVVKEGFRLGVMDVIAKPAVPYIIQRRVSSVVELFLARRRLRNVVEHQHKKILSQTDRIMELNFGMIEALSTAIEFRSGESGTHVRRIHDITYLMLQETDLGKDLSQEQIRQISLAAIMHDVGKIAISDSILNKPGKLTPEEYEEMKLHTVRGAELLEKIPAMRRHDAYVYAYDIARHHHERWDGSGYPDGLCGEEISIWAQIVSLADVYDALISERVYKQSFPREQAISMIRQGKCGVFNPELLEAFLEMESKIHKLYQRRFQEE